MAGGVLAVALAAFPAIGPAEPAHAAANVSVSALKLPFGSDFGGRGIAINDSGEIAGWSTQKVWIGNGYVSTDNAEYWSPGGAQINLNPPLAGGSRATLLNRNGVIAGQAGGEAVAWIDRRPINTTSFACMGIPNCRTASSAINDNDEIAVVREHLNGSLSWDEEAALWKNGTRSSWVRIGVGEVNAMDSAGTMVGEHAVGNPNTGYEHKAFTLSGGTLSDLPSPGWPASRAVAVNDNGQILGEVADPGFYPGIEPTIHAVVWQNGQMTDLGTLGGGNSSVRGSHSLNSQGQVVGTSDAADGTKHAFIWQNGHMNDLGVGSFDPANAAGGSDAWAINNRGQVIGQADRGFFWQNGSVTWLPESVVAYAINNNSEMAGEVYSPILNNHFGGTAPARIVVTS